LKKVLEEVLPEGEIVSITVRDDHYDSNGPNHPIGEFSIEAIIIKSLF
jgi:hypothetical protein